ncbi:Spt20 family-domain-containing protein [Lipomyces orientalis]|uniref:Spt20 family-domain-containing protein n=1 Tax=Lipomyces orientalis TaxID=1233043 RepID=A0ACC3TN54_9ASCO
MVSTASKTRPGGLNNTHRPVNASASKTKPIIANGIAAKSTTGTPTNAQTPSANVKKIKLTQKNSLPNGTSSSTSNLATRKPGSTSMTTKSHVNNSSIAPTISTNSPANAIVRNHIIDDETYYKAGGKRPTLSEYKFAETSEEILQKYKDFPPSIEFHMHPTHYRFGNQDAIIPKNSPLIKNFLELVELEQIPPAAVEIFKEAGVQYYEGCIILQVYDHRGSAPIVPSTQSDSSQSQLGVTNLATSVAKDQGSQKSVAQGKLNATTGKATVNTANSANKKPTSKQAAAAAAAAVGAEKRVAGSTPAGTGSAQPTMTTTSAAIANPQATVEPKTYRTLLRPTPLTMWYDINAGLDGANNRFSDSWALELESKILAATVPRLNLSVPDESALSPQIPPMLQLYPSTVAVPDKYGGLHAPNPPTNAKRKRPLHEDLPHQGTEYEEMMLIMDERPPAGTGQFLRLGFVEQWRRKRERERLQRASSANNSNSAGHRR